MIKKFSRFIILFVFTFTSLTAPFWQAKQVEAVFGVGDIVIDPNNIWQGVKDTVLIPLVASISDRLVDKLVNDTINWSNNGGEGKPGFINNWDDFLKDTQHELIAATFDAAMVAAGSVAYTTSTQDYNNCVSEAKNVYEINSSLSGELNGNNGRSLNQFISDRCNSQINISTETQKQVSVCKGSDTTALKFIDKEEQNKPYKEYMNNLCSQILEAPISVAQKRTEYDVCIKTAPELFIDSINKKEDYATFAEKSCGFILPSELGDVAAVAQMNYDAYQRGEIQSARDVARNLGSYGKNILGVDKLTQIIEGKGETITPILSSVGSNRDEYNKDFGVAGWWPYMALGDPLNTREGKNATVRNLTSEKVSAGLNSIIDNVQTENKYLDKITCNGVTDAEGNCIGREITITPGNLVANAVSQSLQSDQTKAGDIGTILASSLIKGLGKLTDHFIQRGVSNISNKANESFFQSSDVNKFINNITGDSLDYQSEYDVLGIKSDGELSDNAKQQAEIDGLEEEDRIKALIGGPEDVKGGPDDPQIIIDLKENLENAIDNNALEQKNFEAIRTIIDEVKDAAITLDRCNPGPDYNWQQRYEDKLKTHSDSIKQTNNLIGLAETESMATDPRVNIPGSPQMSLLFERIVSGDIVNSPEIDERMKDLRENQLTLSSIKTEVIKQINDYKLDPTINNPDLILFRSDWEKFDFNRKVRAFESAINTGYAIIPDENMTATEYIQTITSDIRSNETKARDAVIGMSWDIWRDKTNQQTIVTTNSGRILGKKDLRYMYYLIEDQVSNETFVKKAEVRKEQTASLGTEVSELSYDCLILRSFVFNQAVQPLNLNNLNNDNKFKRQMDRIAELANQVIPPGEYGLNTLLFTAGTQLSPKLTQNAWGMNLGVTSRVTYMTAIRFRNAKNDDQIKSWLETEYQKQIDGNPNTQSVFLTEYITNPGSIENSILGFSGEVEVVVPERCEYPEIYEIPISSITDQTVEKDFDRDELDINLNSSSTTNVAGTTTYTGTATGACTGSETLGLGSADDCTAAGQTYCDAAVDGTAYECTAQTSGGGTSTNSNTTSASFNPEESGTREQTNQEYIYVDEFGNVYEIYAEDRDEQPVINYQIKSNEQISFINGKLPSTAKSIFSSNESSNKKERGCVAEHTIMVNEDAAYIQEKYPPLSEQQSGWQKFVGFLGELISLGNGDSEIVPAESIQAIFAQDRVLYGAWPGGKISGILFCRNANGARECTKNWYTASDLHYKLLFSGIR